MSGLLCTSKQNAKSPCLAPGHQTMSGTIQTLRDGLAGTSVSCPKLNFLFPPAHPPSLHATHTNNKTKHPSLILSDVATNASCSLSALEPESLGVALASSAPAHPPLAPQCPKPSLLLAFSTETTPTDRRLAPSYLSQHTPTAVVVQITFGRNRKHMQKCVSHTCTLVNFQSGHPMYSALRTRNRAL